jgi:putative transposase
MSLQTLKLTDKMTRQATQERLASHLPIHAAGYECSTETVLDVLIEAAINRQTIETTCTQLDQIVDGETVRGYLNEQLRVNDLYGLEWDLNQSLAAGLPRRLRKTKLHLAIDFHDEPFYGHSPELVAYACRGEAKAGTTRFFRVATAYVIFKGLRLTLALALVRPTETTVEIVEGLLWQVQRLGLPIARLYLDKGFCSIPVLRLLQDKKLPALVACPKRGKQGGVKGLCRGRASYQTEHTFKSQDYGSCKVPVTLVRTFTSHRRSKRKNRRGCWLAFVVLNCHLAPASVRTCYRRRFGIETSYRCMRQVRARTTSRNAALRFVLISLGFVLVNLWVELRWRFCQVKQPHGPRQIEAKRFELARMISFLQHAIEQVYGVVWFIEATVPPLGV